MSIHSDIIRARTSDDIDRIAARHAQSDRADLLKAISAEVNRLLRTDLKAAGHLVSHLFTFKDYWGQQLQPMLIAIRARVALWAGEYRQATIDYQQALRLHQKARNYQDVARIRMAMVEAYLYSGQYQDALDVGRKALQYFRRTKQDMQAAKVMTNLGNVYHRMDRNRQALSWYEKARDIFARQGGVPLAIVEYNRGNIYANLNQLGQARKLYASAAQVYDQAGMEIAENQAIYSIAYLAFLESRYTQALQLFEQVSNSFERLGDKRSALTASMDIVEMDIQLNQYGSAIMLGDSILPQFSELGMTYEEAKTTYFVALARLKLGDHASALRRLNRARRLFDREQNKLWLGMVSLAESKLYQQRGSLSRALQSTRDAEKLFVTSRDLRRQIDAELGRLELLYLTDNLTDAARLSRKLQRRKLAAYQRYELHKATGDHLYRQKDYAQARSAYRIAVRFVEKMLRGIYPDEIGFFFAADKYHCYARLVSCQRHLGRVRDSLVTNLRALSLINHRVVPEERLRKEVPAELLDRMDQLRAVLHRAYQSPRPGERSVVSDLSYSSTEQQLWQLERQARLHIYSRQSAGPATLEQPSVETLMPAPGETLVSFFEGEQSIGAYLSSQDTTSYIDLKVTPAQLSESIRKLYFVLEKSITSPIEHAPSRAAEAYLHEVYEKLFEPLESSIVTERIRLVASGLIAQLPIMALGGSESGWLKDKYHISLVADPSRVASRPSTELPFRLSQSAVLAVPSATLPMVEAEAEAIIGAFTECKQFVGKQATRRHVADALQSSDGFVHLATHASRSSENPVFSRLLMSDGPFFLFDLFGTGIKARLVTLSGCQTAAPGLYYGNSLSLAKAFQQAGARHVLASLWQVSDAVAMTFMTAFYRHLKDSDSVSESYYYAVSYIQQLTPNPAHWGGFVLLGD